MGSKQKQVKLQDVWLKHYLDHTNHKTFLRADASVRAAGFDIQEKDVRSYGRQMRNNWEPVIAKWMEEEGLTVDRLKAKLIQLLEAKETKFFPDKDRRDDKGNMTIEEREVDALGVQAKALEMGLRVQGMYAPEKHELSGELTLANIVKDLD